MAPFYGWDSLSQGYRATMKRQFTFYHLVPRSSWYSIDQPKMDNYLSFSNIEINKPLPAPVQCLIDQIQVQKPILVVATDQMPDHI